MNSDVTNTTATWTYDPAGRPTGRTDTNTASATVRTTAITYNPDNTLASNAIYAGTSSDPLLGQDVYSYDDDGNITSQAVSGTAERFTNTYSYNPADNLTSWTQAGVTTNYTWDHNANRLTSSDPTSTSTWTYRADNSLNTQQTGTSATISYHYSYAGELDSADANSGTDICATYSYDDFQRTATQTQNTDTACGTTSTGTTTYTYDGLDRQQQATVTGATPAAANTTTHNSYDGLTATLIGQTGAVNGTHTNPTVLYQLNPDANPTALAQTSNGTTTTTFLNTDGQGNITSLLNTGTTTASCTVNYDPYGNPKLGTTPPTNGNGVCASGSDASTTGNAVWYRTQSRDPNHGTYQLGTRTYNPQTANFTTPDTARVDTPATDLAIGTDPLTINTFAYVNGNPVNFTDKNGHISQCHNGPDGWCYVNHSTGSPQQDGNLIRPPAVYRACEAQVQFEGSDPAACVGAPPLGTKQPVPNPRQAAYDFLPGHIDPTDLGRLPPRQRVFLLQYLNENYDIEFCWKTQQCAGVGPADYRIGRNHPDYFLEAVRYGVTLEGALAVGLVNVTNYALDLEGIGALTTALGRAALGRLARSAIKRAIERNVVDDVAAETATTVEQVVARNGANLAKVLGQDQAAIQSAASRIGKPISLVGSRSTGNISMASDYDYVVTGATKEDLAILRKALPSAYTGIGEPPGIDIFTSGLEPGMPYITFNP